MFSFGIAKGPKGARGIIWIMRLAPWMVHAKGASMWDGHLSVERLWLSDKRSTMMFMVSIGHALSTCSHACGIGALQGTYGGDPVPRCMSTCVYSCICSNF